MTIIRDPRTNIKLKDSTGTGAKYRPAAAVSTTISVIRGFSRAIKSRTALMTGSP